MTRVFWSARAERDLDSASDFIADDNLDAAERLIQTVERAAEKLGDYPLMGRTGKLSETRELSVPGQPYFLVYRCTEQGVEILRVLHGARDWP